MWEALLTLRVAITARESNGEKENQTRSCNRAGKQTHAQRLRELRRGTYFLSGALVVGVPVWLVLVAGDRSIMLAAAPFAVGAALLGFGAVRRWRAALGPVLAVAGKIDVEEVGQTSGVGGVRYFLVTSDGRRHKVKLDGSSVAGDIVQLLRRWADLDGEDDLPRGESTFYVNRRWLVLDADKP